MDKALSEAAKHVGDILLDSELRVTTAESCTAGLIGMAMAAVENSGHFYTSSFITYTDNAKIRILKVKKETIERHTAVSEQTAREMANGASALSGEPVSLSITGYAGPDGGEDGTPAGTIWFGWNLPNGEQVAEVRKFEGEPKSVMDQGATFALRRLAELLQQANQSANAC